MILLLITIPVMLLAVAIATVPVLHTMVRDERRRRHAAHNPALLRAIEVEKARAEEFETALAA